ncbi:YfcC family protein [Cellulophaga sp. 20_2_10]|uniref:YfcC family protein n=1 Tax=Cellulophaga sp. 20_2_10 TaxID=2942476 RepID=UPI00201AA623|nr:YfcC family protein [Cellulophaga sp. 20_2_10]MCL5244345.1 YfcC family protein [Cellulophaga sp. 20_2_10]
MKKLKFPSAQAILLVIAALVAVLTYVVPAGKYDTLTYNESDSTFTRNSSEKSIIVPATQETLTSLHINIPLEKFKNGDIRKPIGIPDTYKEIEAQPQGVAAFFKSPIKGIIEAADIIFLVLIIGGLIAIMNLTGAFDAGIAWLANKLQGKEYILIILVTCLIALGGTTFGLEEEIIAFYPILIPIFLAAKYDAMVALASIYIGSCIGTLASTINPFSVIIASNAAGINWTSGIDGRLITLVLGLVICIVYITRYAQRVKKDPTKSIIYDQKAEIAHLFGSDTAKTDLKLTARLRLILLVFTACFVVMVYGVSSLDWWFVEMTTVFLIGSIVIGFIAKIKETQFIDTFVKGAGDLLGVAFIIGIAKGVTVLMQDGAIGDTLLYYASSVTSGMEKGIFINAVMLVYSGLSFFIPSTSGMAVLSMPIMSPLADTAGIGREMIVNAYLYGMGLFKFINPTGLILASLAIVKVGYNKWLKFVWPLVAILTIFLMIVLTVSVYI